MRSRYSIVSLIIFCSFLSCSRPGDKDPIKYLQEVGKTTDAKIGSENYRFTLPEDWGRIDTLIVGNKVTFLMCQSDTLKPIINITNEYMRGASHDDCFKGSRKYLINNMPEVHLLDEGKFMIADKECLWFSYNLTKNSITRQIVYYSIENNGVSCNISAGVTKPGLKKYKQTFDDIIKSFRIGN